MDEVESVACVFWEGELAMFTPADLGVDLIIIDKNSEKKACKDQHLEFFRVRSQLDLLGTRTAGRLS